MAGRRGHVLIMSLSNSSSWFRTGAGPRREEGREKRQGKREMEPGKEMWSQADRYSQRREDTDAEESETKKMTEVDRKRATREKVSGKEAEDRSPQRTDGEREGRKREYGEKGDRGDIWKTWGGELSEHPILEEEVGVGDDGGEIVRSVGGGKWCQRLKESRF